MNRPPEGVSVIGSDISFEVRVVNRQLRSAQAAANVAIQRACHETRRRRKPFFAVMTYTAEVSTGRGVTREGQTVHILGPEGRPVGGYVTDDEYGTVGVPTSFLSAVPIDHNNVQYYGVRHYLVDAKTCETVPGTGPR